MRHNGEGAAPGPEGLVLTGSERQADELEARGQGQLLEKEDGYTLKMEGEKK